MIVGVVGGSGYLGSRLCRALADAGHAPVAFSRHPDATDAWRAVAGDVRDAGAVARVLEGCACVYDVGGVVGDAVQPASLYREVNVGGARNVAAAAAAHGIARIVFASSAAVYGLGRPLADEAAAPAPFDDYGRSKLEAEAVYRAWCAADPRRSLAIVRSCAVFGDRGEGNLRRLVDYLRGGGAWTVGDGANRKSIAWVGNLVDFLATLVAGDGGVRIYNYADKPDLTAAELVARILALLGDDGRRIVRVPYPLAYAAALLADALARVTQRRYALSRARLRKFRAETTIATDALLRSGFRARCPLDEALARTVREIAGPPAGARDARGDAGR